jgi:hypothetical protein
MQITQLHLKTLLDLANQLQQEVIDLNTHIRLLEAENARLAAKLSGKSPQESLQNGQELTMPQRHEG